MDIQWQQAQALFQLVITFDIASSILVAYLKSIENGAQESAQKTRSDLSKLMKDVLIIKFSVAAGEWRGPNVFEKFWEQCAELNVKFEPIYKKLSVLSGKIDSERFIYIMYAVLTGIQFTALLFYSTLHPLQSLPISWIWSFGLSGFAPSLFALIRAPWWYFRFVKIQKAIFWIDFDVNLVIDVASAGTAGAENKPNVQIHQYKVRRGL